MPDQFTVKAGEFEGPLELLLKLIEKRKLHISQVSLATVADNFVTFVNKHSDQSLGSLADFLVVASTLMLIKSSALLPALELNQDEKSDMAELERRLKVYKQLQSVAVQLRSCWQGSSIFFRPPTAAPPTFSPSARLAATDWPALLRQILRAVPQINRPPTVAVRQVISLESVIKDLAERVNRALRLSFRQYAGHHHGEKANIIVSFLGLLELVKRGTIAARQVKNFEDIEIETATQPQTPRY